MANAVVKTEMTKGRLPSSEETMGALLWKGGALPSERTLRRHGKKAIEDTEEELRLIFQALAA